MNFGKFDIGQLLITNGVADMAKGNSDFKIFIVKSFARYIHCDWGEMCDDDKNLNDDAVKNGERIHGSYEDKDKGFKTWIITEWDRSVTTILLPDEY